MVALSTSNRLFQYSVTGLQNTSVGASLPEMLYSGAGITNCSVQSMVFSVDTNNPNSVNWNVYPNFFFLFDKAEISCTTSAGQYIILQDTATYGVNYGMAGIPALGDWSFYLVNSVHCLGLGPFLSNYSSVQMVYEP